MSYVTVKKTIDCCKKSVSCCRFPSRRSEKKTGTGYVARNKAFILANFITKTCPYNFDPRKPHFYIVKLGFTGVYIIFLISAQKHRLWVLVRTASSRKF